LTITSTKKIWDDKYSIEDERELDKRYIHLKLVEGFKRAAFPARVPIPLITLPEITESNKRPNTYQISQISCIKHCIYANVGLPNQCRFLPARRQGNVFIGCWNFEGKQINLQICKKCNAVRYIESPTRQWGICQKCRGESEEEPLAKFPLDKKLYDYYLTEKKKRIEALKSE
jgi:hypothetical protein